MQYRTAGRGLDNLLTDDADKEFANGNPGYDILVRLDVPRSQRGPFDQSRPYPGYARPKSWYRPLPWVFALRGYGAE